MEVWPTSLPTKPLREGVNESMGDNVLRTQMSRGPAKTRRRTISTPDTSGFMMAMSYEQWATLKDWHDNTLKASARFEMPDPFEDGVTRIARFTRPPSKSYFSVNRVKVTLQVEFLGYVEA